MSGEGGLATGLRRGGDGLLCLVSALFDMLMFGPITVGFVFFFVFLFIASLRPWSLATSGASAMALCPKRAALWPATGLCDLKNNKKKKIVHFIYLPLVAQLYVKLI